ncbi:unnamed protein product [Urochloa humidicola]
MREVTLKEEGQGASVSTEGFKALDCSTRKDSIEYVNMSPKALSSWINYVQRQDYGDINMEALPSSKGWQIQG